MNKTELNQIGDGNVQVAINNGDIHVHQNLQAEAFERLEAKVDLILSIIINSKDNTLISHVKEHLSQFDTVTLDSYNGENTTHILIPVDELFKKPMSPSIKKLITNKRVGLNYKGIDLQRDLLSVSNILSQMRDIDA